MIECACSECVAMVKSCDSALALGDSLAHTALLCRFDPLDKDMKVQGSRNGKALDVSELLAIARSASARSASAPLDRSWIYKAYARLEEQ